MSMEFWGVKVVAGKQRKVDPGAGRFIHISQAAIHISKKFKDNDFLTLSVKTNDKDFVLGKLPPEGTAQLFDLVFDKEFVLSHSGKTGSVYLCGYSSANTVEVEIATEDASDHDDEDGSRDDSSKQKVSDEESIRVLKDYPSMQKVSDKYKNSKAEEESSEDSESYEDYEYVPYPYGNVEKLKTEKPKAGKKRSLGMGGGSNKKILAAPEWAGTMLSEKRIAESKEALRKARHNMMKKT